MHDCSAGAASLSSGHNPTLLVAGDHNLHHAVYVISSVRHACNMQHATLQLRVMAWTPAHGAAACFRPSNCRRVCCKETQLYHSSFNALDLIVSRMPPRETHAR
jgi:hypothetical protein